MAKFISKLIPAGDNVDVYYLKDKIVRDSIGVASGTSIGTGVTSLGIASLGNDGKIPSSQLPSYVDDVIDLLNVTDTAPSTCAKDDLYYNTTTKKIYTATAANTWNTTGEDPEESKIYVNATDSKCYRWSGSTLVLISSADQYSAGDGIDIISGSISVDDTVMRIGGSDSQVALNAPDIVNNVAYNSSTHKLTMVKNSVSSDIVTIVTSGFELSTNESTGTDVFTAVGGATLTYNSTTGTDVFTF